MTYRWLVHLLLLAAVVGCGRSPNARFYTLEATAQPDGSPPAACAVVVGPVSLPLSVDRPQLVLQVAPNQVRIDELDRWAAPLDDGIARAIAGDLAVLLGTSEVGSAPAAGITPTHRVTVDVQRLEARPGEQVELEALWAVRPSAGGPATVGRTVATESAQGPDVDAVAPALSRALATVSADIAAAIRARLPDGEKRRR